MPQGRIRRKLGRAKAPHDDEEKNQLKEYLDSILNLRTSGQGENNAQCKTTRLDDIPSDSKGLPEFLRSILMQLTRDLSSSETLKLMIRVLDVAKTISEKPNRALVKEAFEILPAQVFQTIWVTVAQKTTPREAETSGIRGGEEILEGNTTLLLCLSGECVAQGYPHMTPVLWSDFFNSLKFHSRKELMKRQLELGSKMFTAQESDPQSFVAFAKGVEAALTLSNVEEVIAALLEDEVQESKASQGSFFQTSPIGTLLSYRNLLKRDGRGKPNVSMGQNSSDLKQWCEANDADRQEGPASKSLERQVRTILIRLLGSRVKKHSESLLAWMAAVINKNKARLESFFPETEDCKEVCGDAYLLSFCSAILELVRSFENSLRPVDGSYFSSTSCRIDLLCDEVSLTGNRIQNVGTSPKKGKNLSGAECFHLCQRAVSIGILKTLETALRVREINRLKPPLHGGSGDNPPLTDTLHVYKLALRDFPSLEVTEFYLLQCRLLRIFETPQKGERDTSDERHRTLSRIPEFCIRDLINWISGTSQLNLLKIEKSFEPILKICIQFLLCTEVELTSFLRHQMVHIISLWFEDEGESTALKLLDPFLGDFCPMILQMYVDMSASEGLQVFSGTFDSSVARHYVANILLQLWHCEKLQCNLMAQGQNELRQSFLIAVLNTTLHLTKRAVENRTEAQGKRRDEVGSELDPKAMKSGDDSSTERNALKTNFQLLCLLSKSKVFVDYFTLAPIAHQAATQLLWMTDITHDSDVKSALKVDYGVGDLNKDAHEILKCVIYRDSKLREDLIWSLGFLPENFRNTDGGIIRGTRQEQSSLISRCAKMVVEICDKAVSESLQDEDGFTSAYQEASRESCLTSASLVPSHSFRDILERFSPTSKKSQVLEKEMQYLEEHLPVLPERAIFLVRDSERYDVLRCAMSGPVGTPYSRGLFTFDIYCPDGYPRCPPLVRFLTTGYGTVDFHACLGANGEVFLTLLGTGSGDDGSQAWDPETSSISQVLETIQTSILEKSPLFSYPCKREQAEDKGERDEEESQLHNSLVQVQTLRYAMLEQLHFPLPGLEEVVGRHFSLQREAIIEQFCH